LAVLRRVAFAILACLLLVPASFAQQPETPAAPAQQTQADSETAQHIRDLMAGKLSAEIDARDLFTRSVASAGGTRDLLELLNDPAALKQAKADKSGAVNALALAQAEFLSLPEKRRTELLAAHDANRTAKRAEAAASEEKVRLLRTLEARAAGLEGFLAGQRVDPATLTIDLLDPAEAALRAERRKQVLAGEPADGEPAATPSAPVDPSELSVDDLLAQALAKVDGLRARMLALAPAERERLLQIQSEPGPDVAAAEQAQAQAELAARLAADARLEAERASSETLKLVAYERGRLLGVRQAQAEFEATLARQGSTTDEMSELTLGWRRQVRELQMKPGMTLGRADEADRIYGQVVSALRNVRTRLDAALADAPQPAGASLDPPAVDPGLSRDLPGGAEVLDLREDLVAGAERLRQASETHRRRERTALFDAMTDLNETRLSLIADLTSELRSRTIGFGEAGIQQVAREFNQIGLTMRYNFASAPEQFARTIYPVMHPTPGLVLILFQVVALVLFFRFWRRNGRPVLIGLQRANAAKQPPTVRSAAWGAALRYYREVRQPAEWLLLLLLLRWIIGDTLQFVGDRIVWSLLFWFLLGALVVRALNGLARSKTGDDPRGSLRLRSLRLITGVGVGAGLILSLTADVVGAGAIYNWVLSVIWLLVPPVIVILANWWRDRIEALAKAGSSKSVVLAWAAKNNRGIVGQVSRVVAGALLVLQGLWAIVAQRMNDIAVIREIVDQRNRKAAAAKAAEDEASGRYVAITEEEAEVLSPHREPMQADPARRNQTDRIIPDLAPGTLTAFTGERGLGKTTALRDALHLIPEDQVVRLRGCDRGFAKLLSDLAGLTGADGSQDDIIAALRKSSVRVIVVDDVQRMMAPTIGGLRDFDRLVAFARATGTACAWAFGIGEYSLAYLMRARSDHATFDAISYLPRWEATDLRALLERRTSQTGFVVSFDHLVDHAVVAFSGEETPEERTRRLFYARLADYSAGNPAVALEFWRRSLFRNLETGQVEVRTFTRPPVDAVDALPQSALFVLRTILQMDVADAHTIVECTAFDPVVVGEMLRHLERIGVIVRSGSGYRTTLYWYREAGRVLERQNLLARSEA
jgi:hypothetical protein